MGGIVLGAAVFWRATRGQAPVLQRDDVIISMALLPAAGAAMLTTHLATLRGKRSGTEELYGSAPVTLSERTVGHLLSVTWAVTLAALLSLLGVVSLMALHSVGTAHVAEILVGPAAVGVLGVGGVALARWIRSAVFGPVAIVVVAALQLGLATLGCNARSGLPPSTRWLGLWVPTRNCLGAPPPELLVRAAGWHAIYLLGLAAAIAGAAWLRSGGRGGAVALGVPALVLTLVAALVQMRSPSDSQRAHLVALLLQPGRYQTCQEHSGVRFCAFPAYAGWISRWEAAVIPVASDVPSGNRVPITVSQFLGPVEGADVPYSELFRASHGDYPPPMPRGTVLVPVRWASGTGQDRDQLDVALRASAAEVGLPADHVVLTERDIKQLESTCALDSPDCLAPLKVGDPWETCSTYGEARAVVAMWLAGAAMGSREAFLEAVRSTPNGIRSVSVVGPDHELVIDGYVFEYGLSAPEMFDIPGGGLISWSSLEANYASQLLTRPREEVARQIRANWALLTAPDTPTNRIVEVLGLRALPTVDQDIARLHLAPQLAKRVRASVFLQTVPCH